MEKFYQNTTARVFLALVCCALWGSAFPCVKIGYEMFHIEGAGSQILFAGYRFFLSGVLTYAVASMLERRLITMKWSSVPCIRAGAIADDDQLCVLLYRTCPRYWGQGFRHQCIQCLLCDYRGPFPHEGREDYLEESHRLPDRIRGRNRHQCGAGRVGQRIFIPGRGNQPSVRDHLWDQFCDDETDIPQGKPDDNHRLSAAVWRRGADDCGLSDWRQHVWI